MGCVESGMMKNTFRRVGNHVGAAALDLEGVVVVPVCGSNNMLVDVVKHFLHERSFYVQTKLEQVRISKASRM